MIISPADEYKTIIKYTVYYSATKGVTVDNKEGHLQTSDGTTTELVVGSGLLTDDAKTTMLVTIAKLTDGFGNYDGKALTAADLTYNIYVVTKDTAVTNLASLQALVDPALIKKVADIAPGTDTAIVTTVDGLTANTAYDIYVTAANGNGEGSMSAKVVHTTRIVYGTVPQNTQKEGNRELRLQNTQMTGDDVEFIQRVLFVLGYDLVIDGVFGSGTAEAVKHFQKANGMKATGSVGSKDKYKLLLMAEKRINNYDRARPGKSQSEGIAVDSANWGVDVLKLGVKGYELQNMSIDELLYTLNDEEYMASVHRDTEALFESNDRMVEHVEKLADAVDDSVNIEESMETVVEKTSELMDGIKGWFDN